MLDVANERTVVEIIPGEGLPVARVGQSRAEIEAVVGPATTADPRCATWRHHAPPFGVFFDHRGRAELVEVYHDERSDDHATLEGVQLTYRLMEDVVSDLARAGVHGRHADIVAEFDQGFTLWSLLSLSPHDLDPADRVADLDDRLVVEGVGIAPAHYWTGA